MKPASPRIILVAPTAESSDRARALDIEHFIITTKERAISNHIASSPYTLVVDNLLDEHILPILLASHRISPFHGVLSLTEYGLEPAARIAQALGIAGVPLDTVLQTRNKELMRRALANTSLPQVKAQKCLSTAEVNEFGRQHGFPVIIKPVDGVGSAMVHRVDNTAEVARLFNDGSFSDLPSVLVEEYLEGSEYSVECFSIDSAHNLLAITQKELVGGSEDDAFVELSHAIPAPLPEDAEVAISHVVSESLTALGVTNGPTHTEIKLTPEGPRIIETHTRLGGDYIPNLVQIATGIDLYEQTLRWISGLPVDLNFSTVRRSAAIRFLTPRPGSLSAVYGTTMLDSLPGVVQRAVSVKAGDVIRPIKRSRDRAGHIIASSTNVEDALAICQRGASMVRFEYDSSDVAGRPMNL